MLGTLLFSCVVYPTVCRPATAATYAYRTATNPRCTSSETAQRGC